MGAENIGGGHSNEVEADLPYGGADSILQIPDELMSPGLKQFFHDLETSPKAQPTPEEIEISRKAAEVARTINPAEAFEVVNGRERYTGPVPPGGMPLINPRTRNWGSGVKIMVVDEDGFIIGEQG